MSTEPYTPDEAGARLAYVDGLFASGTRNIKEQREELRAEFDRFVAKIKADARIAAWKEVAEFMHSQISDDVTVLRAAHLAATTIYYRASQIEQEKAND